MADKKWIAVGTLGVALAFAALSSKTKSGEVTAVDAASDSGALPSSASARAWAWADATDYTYAFDWTATQKSELFGRPVEGRTRVAGELVLRAYSREPDGDTNLRVTFRELRAASLRMLEEDILGDDEAARKTFERGEAYVRVSPRGVVRSVAFREGEPDVFVHLSQWLVERLFVALPAGADESFLTEEPHAFGRALVRYQREGASLARTLVRFQELALGPETGLRDISAQDIVSKGRVKLAPEGHLLELSDVESIGLARPDAHLLASTQSSLSVRMVARKPSEGRATIPERLVVRTPGSREPGPTASRKALLQRVDGLTRERMVQDLASHGGSGEVPDHARWLWRTTGLLRLEPALAKDVAAVFTRDSLGPRGRALVMDLLAFAGTHEAQASLRDLLRGPVAAMAEDERIMLVQRVSFLRAPEEETLSLVARDLERAPRGSLMATACAYSLGAALGHLGQDDDRVVPYEKRLRESLERASSDAGERSTYLRALGNAGFARNLGVVLGHVGDPEPAVRASAATALRKTPSAQASAALVKLAADPAPVVQRTAIEALGEHPLDGPALRALATALTSPGVPTPPDVLGAVLNLVARAGVVDGSKELLELVRDRAADDPQLRDRAVTMLSAR